MKCETYCLGNVCTFIDYRGKTPPKTTSGIPLITAKIVKNGAIQEPQEFIAESYYDEWMRRGIPKQGSVVFTTEAPLGEVARIRTNDKLAFAQRIIVLESKQQYLNPDYLFYSLQDCVLKSRIEARATGTTVIGIKAAELKRVEIDLPPLLTQKQIAAVLCVIDHIDEFIFDGTYLLIAEDGENLKSKKQNIAQVVDGQFWVNNHAHIVQGNALCDTRYLCYLLNSIDLSGYVTGSAQPKLSQANLNAVTLSLPSIDMQKKIVECLYMFDQKIAVNQKINDNLQQQAFAFFDRLMIEAGWFYIMAHHNIEPN